MTHRLFLQLIRPVKLTNLKDILVDLHELVILAIASTAVLCISCFKGVRFTNNHEG